MSTVRNFWNDDQDKDLIEYSLLMAFVALASAALILTVAGGILETWAPLTSCPRPPPAPLGKRGPPAAAH